GVDDRVQVAADDDQVHARVRTGSRFELRQRLAVRLADDERHACRLADRDRRGRLEVDERVRLRRLNGREARAAGRAAAAGGREAHEQKQPADLHLTSLTVTLDPAAVAPATSAAAHSTRLRVGESSDTTTPCRNTPSDPSVTATETAPIR